MHGRLGAHALDEARGWDVHRAFLPVSGLDGRKPEGNLEEALLPESDATGREGHALGVLGCGSGGGVRQ